MRKTSTKYIISSSSISISMESGNPVPVSMADSGPHKQSILRNKEVPKKNAPRKPRDVTRPTVMVKRLGFRGTLPVKYKIDFWNNPITASILVWNQVVLNQSQQLGYLNSKLMLSWDCPFNGFPFFLCILSAPRDLLTSGFVNTAETGPGEEGNRRKFSVTIQR